MIILRKIKHNRINIIKTIKGVNFVDGYIDNNGVYHPIKGEEKVKIPSEDSEEFNMAVWIKENLGGEIDMVPEMKQAKGNSGKFSTQTPDYIWNNEKWDLKAIDGNSKYTIGHKFEDYKEQTDNLILYPRKTNLSDNEILNYIDKSFNAYSKYYNKVIYIKKYKIIKEFKK